MQTERVNRTLATGAVNEISMRGTPLPATVWARPQSGDTVTITYSCDGGVTYRDWPPGPVTAYTEHVLVSGITHLRAQRTAGSGATSAFGVV